MPSNNPILESAPIDSILDMLKERILSLQYKPGRGLSTASLAKEFGVSREPVREAMLRLNWDGFVESFPKSGSRVSLINLEKTENERFLRKSTELYAIPTFAANRTNDDLQKMRKFITKQQECIEKKNFYQFIQYDNAFHKVIFQGIGKENVWKTVYNHTPNDARVRLLTGTFLDSGFVQVIEYHLDIVKAAEERDSKRARAILEAHLTRTEDELSRVIFMFPDIFTSKQVPNSFFNIRTFESGVDEYFHSLLVQRHII